MTRIVRKLPRRAQALLFAVFLLWPVLLVDASGPPMVDAVLVSAIRLVDAGTWSVSDDPPAVAALTAAFDIAVHDERAYSGAAPGATLLAAAFYVALKPVFAGFDIGVVKSPRSLNYYAKNSQRLGLAPPRHLVDAYLLQIALSWLVIAPLSAAFGVRLLAFVWSEHESWSRALALALAATLASFFIYYASAYSRQALASLLVWHGALTIAQGRSSISRTLVASLLLATSVTVEYSAVAAVAMLLVAWLPILPRAHWGAVLGMIAFALLGLSVYHAELFGAPWSTPYQHRYFPEGKWLRGPDPSSFDRGGFGGVGTPELGVMLELLLGSYKGILVYCPALALATVGHILALGVPGRRRRHLFCVLVIVVYLGLNSGMGSHLPPEQASVVWGGLNILWGPRHLLVTIPFFAYGLAALDWSAPRIRRLTLVAVGVSFAINAVGCFTRQRFLAALSDDPALANPILLAFRWTLRDGPRVPLLEAYGVSPGVQWGLLTLAGVGSAALLSHSFRTVKGG